MIGVIARADQAQAVSEFFELFKTPWELYRHGCAYDLVISTTDVAPDPMPRLFISCGAETKGGDQDLVKADRHHARAAILHDERRVPIYTGLLALKAVDGTPAYVVADVGVAGVLSRTRDIVLRLGYDLFDEARYLLSAGQPAEQADVPTLDLHIDMLRQWMLDAGVSIVEIPPCPAGHDFIVCLTHDIDFVGIRRHLFDHTMWGFLYRATLGGLRDAIRRRIPVARMWRSWRAAASLPFVYLGWAKDFWEPFDWYLETEKGLAATYYLIPFKGRAGERVDARATARRASAYDVADVRVSVNRLVASGCEVGVHGIDAWHDAAKGRDELARLSTVTPEASAGVRMHWLLQDANTPAVLEQAGFAYDSSSGYNETVGYRNGTSQVFRPETATRLLELPMHLQDGALFYPQRLNLSDAEADGRCQPLIEHARRSGGVLTVLWHDRSHGPERFWGDFYARLVRTLKSMTPWFGTARDVVSWFQQRRDVRFESTANGRLRVHYAGQPVNPPFRVLIRPAGSAATMDLPWNGMSTVELAPRANAEPVSSIA